MLLFWRFIASQWLLVLSWLFLLFFVLFLHFLAFLLFYVLSYFLSFCGVLFPCFNWCVLSMAFVAIACSSCFLPLFWFFLLYWLLCLASPSGTIRRCSCFALCVRRGVQLGRSHSGGWRNCRLDNPRPHKRKTQQMHGKNLPGSIEPAPVTRGLSICLVAFSLRSSHLCPLLFSKK